MKPELPELIRQDLGAPDVEKQRALWWLCPFHEDKNASFQVSYYERGHKWRYKCWACDMEGDAHDWLVNYRHMSKGDAWRVLRGEEGAPVRRQDKPNFNYGSEPPAQNWQDAALDICLACAAELPGTSAMDWLQARGLERATIERAMLGWNANWREVLPGYWLAPGVTIPAFTKNALWYVNVRLTKKEAQKRGDKYMALKGSRLASLYNAEATVDAPVACVVEGELDALLLSQFFASDELAVVTMGSATAAPGPRWKKYLAWLDKLLIVLDKDVAGERGVDKWRDAVQWLEVVTPPAAPGKDITDWWKAGADLRSWLLPYVVAKVKA